MINIRKTYFGKSTLQRLLFKFTWVLAQPASLEPACFA